jgi:hypothetical protein
MPVIKSADNKAVGKNIATEMAAGKPQKQAVAIALAVQERAKQQAAADAGKSNPPVRNPAQEDQNEYAKAWADTEDGQANV